MSDDDLVVEYLTAADIEMMRAWTIPITEVDFEGFWLDEDDD